MNDDRTNHATEVEQWETCAIANFISDLRTSSGVTVSSKMVFPMGLGRKSGSVSFGIIRMMEKYADGFALGGGERDEKNVGGVDVVDDVYGDMHVTSSMTHTVGREEGMYS